MNEKIIARGKVVDVINNRITKSNVYIKDGRIKEVTKKNHLPEDVEIIEAEGYFLVPGLIDAHEHNEMTMLSPISFAEAVLPRGTTAVILDIHDSANVIGVKRALRWNIREYKKTLLKAFFMVPSCLPSSNFESCKKSEYKDILECFNLENVIGLGEVMDFEGVIGGRGDVLNIVRFAMKKKYLIDGHCAGLKSERLSRYLSASGVTTDHEFTNTKEARERVKKGLKIIFRKGITNEPNAYEIWQKTMDKSKMMLCTDGCITPNHITKKGHMDYAIRQVIKEGIPALEAVKMASLNVAKHYRLKKVGAIKKDNYADILFVKDLSKFEILKVMIEGEFIDSKIQFKRAKHPLYVIDSIVRDSVKKQDFELQYITNNKEGRINCRIIKLIKNTLLTEEIIEELDVSGNKIMCNLQRDILKVALINRYNKNGGIQNGFIRGFGLKSGALACSNGQDAQNIVVIGTNHSDMADAVNRVIELNGGAVLSENKRLINEIPLPVMGIMTDEKADVIGDNETQVNFELRKRGCSLDHPLFVISSQLTISSIPNLKLTDKGYLEVTSGRIKKVLLKENVKTQ